MSSLHRPETESCVPIVDAVVATLVNVFPDGAGLHEPEFQGNEWTYVKQCIDTGWVSTAGKFVDEFERSISAFTKSPYVVATVNGTAALHTCLILAGVEPGDEVIVPGLGFIATANAVSYCGAMPHFADIETESLGIDAQGLAAYLDTISERRGSIRVNRSTGRPIRAVVCIHMFGHPTDLDPLMAVCDTFGLTLVEDAAESLGSFYKGRHTGTVAPLAALSFNGNKIATTGGGGAVLIRDPDLANRAKHLTTTAKAAQAFEFVHDQVGYNYRLPNLNAALGCAQLERISGTRTRKRALAKSYARLFADVPGVSVFLEPAYAESNYWLNVLLLEASYRDARHPILTQLNDRGILARAAWMPTNLMPMYESCPAMPLPITNDIYDRTIALPSSPTVLETLDGAT